MVIFQHHYRRADHRRNLHDRVQFRVGCFRVFLNLRSGLCLSVHLCFNAPGWSDQLIAGRVFRGSGTFDRLIYATAAFTVPILLISSLISSIPYVQWLAVPVYLYQIVLGVIAVKAVNRIGWGQAFISYITLPALITGIVAVVPCAF